MNFYIEKLNKFLRNIEKFKNYAILFLTKKMVLNKQGAIMSKLNLFFSADELELIKTMDEYHRALTIIGRVYAEKLDKSGNAELGHFIRVSDSLDTIEEKTVGLLHDIVEDGYIDLSDLSYLGFHNDDILTAISILCRDKQKFPYYHDYISSILESENIIAIKTKYYDMLDNISPGRVDLLPYAKKIKALAKYAEELPRLEETMRSLNLMPEKRTRRCWILS